MSSNRALVIGLGLIGASVAAALKNQGWQVDGHDIDEVVVEKAITLGFLDGPRQGLRYDLAVVATPVEHLVDSVIDALATAEVVTDAGSVKRDVVDATTDPRFVGGHPMAGSDKSGPEAATTDLFAGATWLLTPSPTTDPAAYELVRNVITSFGAHVVTLDAIEHDEIVASVSHVPHLTASALMNVANMQSQRHGALPRLAGRGFRDMTRIAAGHPTLWTGIALANSNAIANELGHVIEGLEQMRNLIEQRDAVQLEKVLTTAAEARREMPVKVGRPDKMSLLLVTIPDRPGGLRLVVDVLGENNINLEDFQVTHDESGSRGRLEVSVASNVADLAASTLRERGLPVVVEEI